MEKNGYFIEIANAQNHFYPFTWAKAKEGFKFLVQAKQSFFNNPSSKQKSNNLEDTLPEDDKPLPK